MTAPLDASLLKASGVANDGLPTKFCWKAWPDRSNTFLKWELRRVLPTVGYVEKGNHTIFKDYISKQKQQWLAVFRALGIDEDSAYGDSRHSRALRAARRGELVPETNAQREVCGLAVLLQLQISPES